MGVDTARVVHNELLEDSLRDLVCVFCSDLIDPHDALQASCGHAFCTACILHAIDAGYEACPLDKRSFQRDELRVLKDANPLVYRLLGRTEVRCENFAEGCGWRGDLFDVHDHMKACQTQARHCQCCQMRRDELKAAKELIVGYERLVKDYKRDIRLLKEQVMALESQLQAPRNGQVSGLAVPAALSVSRASEDTLAPRAQGWSVLDRLDVAMPNNTMALPSAPPLTVSEVWGQGLGTGSGEQAHLASGHPGSVHSRLGPLDERGVLARPASQPDAHGGADPLAVVAAAAELQRISLRPVSGRHLASADSGGLPVRASGSAGELDCIRREDSRAAPSSRPGHLASPRSPRQTSPRIQRQPWQGGIFAMTLYGHSTQVTAMAVSPDGRTLFSGSLDGNLRIWRAGRCVFSQASYHVGCVLSLAYAADSDVLYSCGEDKAVNSWPGVMRSIAAAFGPQVISIEEGAMLGPIPMRLCCAGRGRLVVAYSDGRVIAREHSRVVLVIRERGPCSSTLDLVASESGNIFFSGSPDNSIWVHSWGIGTRQLKGHEAEVSSLATGPSNSLVSLSKDGVVKEWSNGALVSSWTGWRALGRLAVGIDGTVYCGKERESVVQCRRNGNCVYTLREDNVCKEEALVVAIGSEGLLYSGERGGAIRMWQCPA